MVEITPEMVKAGVAALSLYEFLEPDEWKVAAVYEAMSKVACSRPSLPSVLKSA